MLCLSEVKNWWDKGPDLSSDQFYRIKYLTVYGNFDLATVSEPTVEYGLCVYAFGQTL
jgi:hypothetical protein